MKVGKAFTCSVPLPTWPSKNVAKPLPVPLATCGFPVSEAGKLKLPEGELTWKLA